MPLFAWRYNQLVFASFNPTLARTRGLTLTLNNYLFIVLLALVVNLSIKAVGALLINALLVVPAAAAANLSRNLRQMFWLTVAFCLGAGLIGLRYPKHGRSQDRRGRSSAVRPERTHRGDERRAVLRVDGGRGGVEPVRAAARTDPPPPPPWWRTSTTRLAPGTTRSDNATDRPNPPALAGVTRVPRHSRR